MCLKKAIRNFENSTSFSTHFKLDLFWNSRNQSLYIFRSRSILSSTNTCTFVRTSIIKSMKIRNRINYDYSQDFRETFPLSRFILLLYPLKSGKKSLHEFLKISTILTTNFFFLLPMAYLHLNTKLAKTRHKIQYITTVVEFLK